MSADHLDDFLTAPPAVAGKTGIGLSPGDQVPPTGRPSSGSWCASLDPLRRSPSPCADAASRPDVRRGTLSRTAHRESEAPETRALPHSPGAPAAPPAAAPVCLAPAAHMATLRRTSPRCPRHPQVNLSQSFSTAPTAHGNRRRVRDLWSVPLPVPPGALTRPRMRRRSRRCVVAIRATPGFRAPCCSSQALRCSSSPARSTSPCLGGTRCATRGSDIWRAAARPSSVRHRHAARPIATRTRATTTSAADAVAGVDACSPPGPSPSRRRSFSPVGGAAIP